MRESLKVAADRLQQRSEEKREQCAAVTESHFEFCDISCIGATDVGENFKLFYY